MDHNRTLYAKDCLYTIKTDIPPASIDLIYLDPPFNSNKNYNLLYKKYYKNKKPVEAFKDTWEWSDYCDDLMEEWAAESLEEKRDIYRLVSLIMKSVQPKYQTSKDCLPAYLLYMAERLIPMRELLKETGSIYLHCDPTASHYLKMLMDMIFGKENFRNEIVWSYRGMPSIAKKWQQKHDIILYYSYSNDRNFNVLLGEPTEGSIRTFDSAKKRGYNVNLSKKMATVFDWSLYEEAIKSGKIPSDLKPKAFQGGRPPLSDWWTDIKILGGPQNKERLGYPTQKPLKLLERIILASSNEGDTVLDPFCGCGTAIHAAEKLKRNWLGIDIAPFSTGLVRSRLLKNTSLTKKDIKMRGMIETIADAHERLKPQTLEARLDFEKIMCGLVGCISIHKGRRPGDYGGDDGIDGVIELDLLFQSGKEKDTYKKGKKFCIVQVKSGGVTVDSVKAFNDTILHEDDETIAGVFVCFKKYQTTVEDHLTKETFKDGFGKYPVAQAFYVEDVLDPNDKGLNLPSYGDQRALL